MKKMFVSLALVLLAVGQLVAQTAAAPTKTIKDPAEFNAYDNAVKQSDPASKASGLESFLTQYPNSVVKEDALENLLGAYQAANNISKLAETAERLVQAAPGNVRGNVLAAYFKNAGATAEKDPQKKADGLAAALKYAEQGLAQLPTMAKPDGIADADFAKQKAQYGVALNTIAGDVCFQTKDYNCAVKYLRPAVDANPADAASVYHLGTSYLFSKPADEVNGLFYVARAVALVPAAQKDAIAKFGKARYHRYHNGDDGWDAVVTAAAANPAPPAGFAIVKYVPPSPEDQVNDLLKKDPKEWDFGLWQFALTEGTDAQKTKIWDAIKGGSFQITGKVISATPEVLTLAASLDDIEQSKADVTLNMTEKIPAKLMPKVGETIPFGGSPAAYAKDPSFTMTMDKGTLLAAKSAEPSKKPVHHPAHR